MSKGKLIVIEGACDGIGKSTQSALLEDRLINDGKEVIKYHFPSYGTKQGALVEEYLKGHYGSLENINNYFVHSLYAVDRAVSWHSYLKEEYNKGKYILLDRYTTSSLIYQSAQIKDRSERIEFLKFALDYEYNKLQIREPDEVIFLHADFDLATKIRNARGQNGVDGDIHEANLEFMKKVYDNAMFIADYIGFSKVKCDENGMMRSIADIHEDVYSLVRKNK